MHLTKHAENRIEQRRISPEQLDWLLSYGTVGHGKGVCFFYFDRDGFAHLLREVEPSREGLALRSRNIYAVISADAVITVGHRDGRLKSRKAQRHRRQGVASHPAARRIQHQTH